MTRTNFLLPSCRFLSSLLLSSRLLSFLFFPLLLLVAGGLTSADASDAEVPPHLSIQVPGAMSPLPGLSKRISTTSGQTGYFGEEKLLSGAIAFGRANRGALYLTWVQSEGALLAPEKAIRSALDSLRRAPYDANENATINEIAYRERAFGDLSEMTWEWVHTENDTVNVVRVLAWKDTNSRAHLEIAECIFGQEGGDDFRAECTNALASLALSESVPIAKLGALAPPTSPVSNAPEDFSVPKLKAGELRVPSSLGVPPSKMGEILYQGEPQVKPQSTNNRVYIGIGLALLALAIWLTTRADPNEKKSWAKDDPKEDPEASDKFVQDKFVQTGTENLDLEGDPLSCEVGQDKHEGTGKGEEIDS